MADRPFPWRCRCSWTLLPLHHHPRLTLPLRRHCQWASILGRVLEMGDQAMQFAHVSVRIYRCP